MSEKTKKDVARVAQELGYKRNSMATGLRKGKSGLIGVMVPWVNLNFFATAIKGIEDVLGAAGYHILIGQSKDSEEKEKKQVEAFLNAQVEGIIASLASSTKTHAHFDNALRTGTKLILFDRTIPEMDVDKVVVDDYNGALLATNHLIQQGYKRIGLISGPSQLMPYQKRIQAYKDALRKNKIVIDESLIMESDISIDNGKQITTEMLELENPPDAIFCLSDLFALGALNALKQKNIKVPEEIGLVGFSNEDFTTYVSPSISSVDQFSEQLGIMAAKSLLEQLESEQNDPTYRFVAKKHVLAPKLLVRESSKRDST